MPTRITALRALDVRFPTSDESHGSDAMNPDPDHSAAVGGPPRPASLTPLSQCYPTPSLLGALLNLPEVQGIIESLVGPDPLFDHDFVHRLPAGSTYHQHLLGEQQFSGVAGTLMVFHHGLWHAGQPNPSDVDRWMYKIRLNPSVSPVKRWNTEDFDRIHNDASDHTFALMRHDSVAQIFRTMQPWQKGHESRYEQMQRARHGDVGLCIPRWRQWQGAPVA